MADLSLTEIREYLQDALHEELNIPIVGGYVEGPVTKDMGCVWWISTRPSSVSASDEEVRFGIRVFDQWREPDNPEKPTSPADLEAIDTTVKALLSEVQTFPGSNDPWFFEIEGSSQPEDEWCVEFDVMVLRSNPFF